MPKNDHDFDSIFALVFARDYNMSNIDYIKFDPKSETDKMPQDRHTNEKNKGNYDILHHLEN